MSVSIDFNRLTTRNTEMACGELQYEVRLYSKPELIVRTNTIIKRIVLGTGSHVHLAARPTDPAYTGMFITISYTRKINHEIEEAYAGKRYNCGSFLAMIHNRSLLLYHSNLDTVSVYNHVGDYVNAMGFDWLQVNECIQ